MTYFPWILIICLAAANLTAFTLFGLDKRRAVRNQWRIPEHTLMLSALLGGSIGALAGMSVFHHKTRKPKFFIGVPVCLALHIGLAVWLFTLLHK